MEYQDVISTVESYWDGRASSFDRDHDTEDLQVWRTVLDGLIGSDRNKTVLDLGAGTGFLTNMLVSMGYAVIGVDVSERMMEYGVRRAELQHLPSFYMKGDAIDLPFCDNSVDCIVNARLIWTIAEPERMFKEWLRVLKPGGKILCFNRMKDDYGLKRYDGPSYANEEIHTKLTLEDASFEELCSLGAHCGYVDVSCDRLPDNLTRPGFDYDNWYVFTATKPFEKTHRDELGMASYWDRSALTYDEHHDLYDEKHWMEVLSGLVGSDKDAKILDVATGTGLIANYLASAGYKNVVGVDISEEMMRIAMKRARECGNDIEFRFGNTLALPFKDDSFDVVINSRLLWTLTEPEHAIQEWYRVLKPGGRVVAINELEESGIEVDLSGQYCQDTGIDDFPFARVSSEDIVGTFEEEGFTEMEVSLMPGCHMKTSDRENWFSFVGIK